MNERFLTQVLPRLERRPPLQLLADSAQSRPPRSATISLTRAWPPARLVPRLSCRTSLRDDFVLAPPSWADHGSSESNVASLRSECWVDDRGGAHLPSYAALTCAGEPRGVASEGVPQGRRTHWHPLWRVRELRSGGHQPSDPRRSWSEVHDRRRGEPSMHCLESPDAACPGSARHLLCPPGGWRTGASCRGGVEDADQAPNGATAAGCRGTGSLDGVGDGREHRCSHRREQLPLLGCGGMCGCRGSRRDRGAEGPYACGSVGPTPRRGRRHA